jgi:hypothetical protein
MYTDFLKRISENRPNTAANLERYHECLAKCDLLSESHPEVSETWQLLAAQWEMIIKLDQWSAVRPQPRKFAKAA